MTFEEKFEKFDITGVFFNYVLGGDEGFDGM